MNIDDFEDRLDELTDGRPDDDLEVIIEDEVVESGWEPDDGEERPEPGVTRTRVYINDAGEWVSEDDS